MNRLASGRMYRGLIKGVFGAVVFTAASIPLALADNEHAPLNYFLHSYGPASTPVMILGWVLASVVIAVLLIIALLLVMAVFRRRAAEYSRVIGPENQGMAWIYIGTGVSACILLGLVIYVLITLNTISKPPRPPALTLTVTGYDWWWKVEYEGSDPARGFVTANEIHIPVGEPILIKLKSADVIHAFWAPLLAGKTQMIPGLVNRQWLEADVEGIYRGQCTQYCGMQHAHMGFEIVAQSPSDFRKWQDEQRSFATPASSPEVTEGKEFFMEHCSGCHTVRGTGADGAHAPDLTHLASRRLIAAGLLTNTPENRIRWITHVQELKPGARMPSFELSSGEITVLSAFLSTLK